MNFFYLVLKNKTEVYILSTIISSFNLLCQNPNWLVFFVLPSPSIYQHDIFFFRIILSIVEVVCGKKKVVKGINVHSDLLTHYDFSLIEVLLDFDILT